MIEGLGLGYEWLHGFRAGASQFTEARASGSWEETGMHSNVESDNYWIDSGLICEFGD